VRLLTVSCRVCGLTVRARLVAVSREVLLAIA
jgi:hypothetical protein